MQRVFQLTLLFFILNIGLPVMHLEIVRQVYADTDSVLIERYQKILDWFDRQNSENKNAILKKLCADTVADRIFCRRNRRNNLLEDLYPNPNRKDLMSNQSRIVGTVDLRNPKFVGYLTKLEESYPDILKNGPSRRSAIQECNSKRVEKLPGLDQFYQFAKNFNSSCQPSLSGVPLPKINGAVPLLDEAKQEVKVPAIAQRITPPYTCVAESQGLDRLIRLGDSSQSAEIRRLFQEIFGVSPDSSGRVLKAKFDELTSPNHICTQFSDLMPLRNGKLTAALLTNRYSMIEGIYRRKKKVETNFNPEFVLGCRASELVNFVEANRSEIQKLPNRLLKVGTMLGLRRVPCEMQFLSPGFNSLSELVIYPFNGVLNQGSYKKMSVALSYDTFEPIAKNSVEVKNQKDFGDLQKEVRINLQLDGKQGIVRASRMPSFYSNEGIIVLTQPYYDGALTDYLGKMTTQDKFRVAYDALKGMGAMHDEHYVHRDIKPDNILIEMGSDGKLHARLSDFGTVTLDGAADSPKGTPYYMSAEAMNTNRRTRSDVDSWALGLTLAQVFNPELSLEKSFDNALKQRTLPSSVLNLKRVLASLDVSKDPRNVGKADMDGDADGFKNLNSAFSVPGGVQLSCSKEVVLFQPPTTRSLICGLLNPNPNNRFTAAKALETLDKICKASHEKFCDWLES